MRAAFDIDGPAPGHEKAKPRAAPALPDTDDLDVGDVTAGDLRFEHTMVRADPQVFGSVEDDDVHDGDDLLLEGSDPSSDLLLTDSDGPATPPPAKTKSVPAPASAEAASKVPDQIDTKMSSPVTATASANKPPQSPPRAGGRSAAASIWGKGKLGTGVGAGGSAPTSAASSPTGAPGRRGSSLGASGGPEIHATVSGNSFSMGAASPKSAADIDGPAPTGLQKMLSSSGLLSGSRSSRAAQEALAVAAAETQAAHIQAPKMAPLSVPSNRSKPSTTTAPSAVSPPAKKPGQAAPPGPRKESLTGLQGSTQDVSLLLDGAEGRPKAASGIDSDVAAAPSPVRSQGPAPAPRVIHELAVIEAKRFPVTFGHGCVVHPYAQVIATNGPIEIGEYCIFEENCFVENKLPPHSDGRPRVMTIGEGNVIGAAVEVRAERVGSWNRMMPYSIIGLYSVVDDGCCFTPGTKVQPNTKVPAGVVVFGERSVWKERRWDRETEDGEVRRLSRWYRQNMSPKA